MAGGINIEINNLDAPLRLGMRLTGTPRPITKLDITDFIQPQTTPFATARQAAPALPGKLIRQSLLLAL